MQYVPIKIIITCTTTDTDIFQSSASCLFASLDQENRPKKRREREREMFRCAFKRAEQKELRLEKRKCLIEKGEMIS